MAEYMTGTIDSTMMNDDRRVIDMTEEILLLDPNRAPFYVVSARAGKQTCHNPKFYWQEDKVMDHMTEVTATQTETSPSQGDEDTIEVDEAAIFLEGDIVLVTGTDEIMLVTDVDTNNDEVTFERGYADTEDAVDQLEDEDELMILSNAREEGAGDVKINMRKVDTPWNYTQIFSTEFGFTGTQMQTEYYGPGEFARVREKKGIEHTEKIERALLWGQRDIDTSGTKPKRLTRGVFNWIESNVEDVGYSLDEQTFDEFLEDAFKHGSDTKLGLASRRALSVISGFAKDNIQTETPQETYGINVQRYITPHGNLDLIPHRQFAGDEYGHTLLVLDMECGTQRPLKNRDTQLRTNIQENAADAQTDQYFTELGLQFEQEERHAIMNEIDYS